MKRMFKYGAAIIAVLFTTSMTAAVWAQGYNLAMGPGSSAVSVGQDAYGRTVVSSSGDAEVAVSSNSPIVYRSSHESQVVMNEGIAISSPGQRAGAYRLPPGQPASIFVGNPQSGVGVAVGPYGGVEVNVGGLGGIFVGVGPEPPLTRQPLLPQLPQSAPIPRPELEFLPAPVPRPLPSLQPTPTFQGDPALQPGPVLQDAPALQPAPALLNAPALQLPPTAPTQTESRDLLQMMQRMEQLESQLADSQAALAELQTERTELQTERAELPEQAIPLRTPQPIAR